MGRFSNLLATYALWWRLLALVERQSRFWCQSAKVGLILGLAMAAPRQAGKQESAVADQSNSFDIGFTVNSERPKT